MKELMDRVQAELKERPDLDTCGVIVDGSGVVHVDIVGTGLDEAEFRDEFAKLLQVPSGQVEITVSDSKCSDH